MLWERWAARFEISRERPPRGDGALDALVCATVAHLYHHALDTLLHLQEQEDGNLQPGRGRGPFYVVAPHG
jgi:hypothetical protein